MTGVSRQTPRGAGSGLAQGELKLADRRAELADTQPRRRRLQARRAKDRVVYAKPPFAGPQGYVAVSGSLHPSGSRVQRQTGGLFDGKPVRFCWRDYAHGNRMKILTLEAETGLWQFKITKGKNRDILELWLALAVCRIFRRFYTNQTST